MSHTVKDFVQQLKDEDKGIERAVVYNLDGTRISQSTGVDVLLQSDFKLLINDETYPVHPPEQGNVAAAANPASVPPSPHTHIVFENYKELLRKSVFSPHFESLVSPPLSKWLHGHCIVSFF